MNIYEECGCENRQDYLESLADEYGVSIDQVQALAYLLGEAEDFDGLVIAVQDIGEY